MYAVVFKEGSRGSLQMHHYVWEDRERAQSWCDTAIRQRTIYIGWVIHFDDPRVL